MADQSIQQSGTALKRRGILAAAGAVVAGILAKQAAQPVTANDQTWTMPYSATTTASAGPLIEVWNQDTSSSVAFAVRGNTASPFAAGIFGGAFADGGKGVRGEASTTGPSSIGVYGVALNDGKGVVGESRLSTGVTGTSQGQVGVQGTILSGSTAANTNAILGDNKSTGANGVGVAGRSLTGYGVVGYTSGGSASMSGISDHTNIPAFAGGNSAPNGLAASFSGLVYINGSFVVQDPTNKHGAIKHPDGSYRLLYSVESPESWLEDFGTETLANGKAEVRLDSDFAAIAQTGDYYVFLTERGTHSHLAVTAQTPSGFTVEAEASGASGGFYWRVVAKPKTEQKAERLAKFVPPEVKMPRVEDLPKPAPPPVKKP